MSKKKRQIRKKRIAKPTAETPTTDGLACPSCGCCHLPVLYTRKTPRRVKRVRECRNCGRRVTSFERIPEGSQGPYVAPWMK